MRLGLEGLRVRVLGLVEEAERTPIRPESVAKREDDDCLKTMMHNNMGSGKCRFKKERVVTV